MLATTRSVTLLIIEASLGCEPNNVCVSVRPLSVRPSKQRNGDAAMGEQWRDPWRKEAWSKGNRDCDFG